MLESIQNNTFEYEKLSPEEMQKRGILGRLKGIIADYKNPTRNGRRYGKELWEKLFNDPITKEKIANRCMFGEIEHPTDGRVEIDPQKIAICLAEQPKLDNKGHLVGVFDILPTPCGQILKTLLDYGTTIGVSSRGTGDTYIGNDGVEEVDPNTYECTGWDAVLLPAVKEARMQFVTESVDGKKTLAMALTESINSASEKDKKIMQETLDDLGISYENSYSVLDEIINHFGILPELDIYSGPTYILPNGQFLDLRSCKHHSDVEKWLIDQGLSSNEYIVSAGSKTLFDLGCIRCDYSKYYIALCEVQPTREQYNSLLIWLDELQKTTRVVEVITPDNQHITYKFDDIISDYIVDRIRRYYSSGVLYEKLNQKHQHDFTYKRNAIGEKISDPDNQPNEVENINATIENEEADNDGDSLVEELQNALLKVQELQNKVSSLQEKLSVCYAKELDYEEEIERGKNTISKLTESVKSVEPLRKRVTSLTEELEAKTGQAHSSDVKLGKSVEKVNSLTKQNRALKENLLDKDRLVKSLQESIEQMKNRLASQDDSYKHEIDSLQEELRGAKKDSSLKHQEYLRKLDNQVKLVERYKAVAKTAVNKYMESCATRLGVSTNEIKSKLGESYTFQDIDDVCDQIQDQKIGLNSLPFGFQFDGKSKVRITESLDPMLPINEDDKVDDLMVSIVQDR